jgi:predicted RNA-binding protein Jag
MKEANKKFEYEDKTVRAAVDRGLKELKLKRSQVKVEILCEEEKGLFDMPGAKLAKIRITVVKEQKTP